MRVLLIDDNKNIGDMFKDAFELHGIQATISSKGREGLELIQNEQFDTVILDLAMPEFNGFEVIEALEKHDLIGKQKVIVLTASEISNEQSDQLFNKDITVLRKPVQLPELLQAIH